MPFIFISCTLIVSSACVHVHLVRVLYIFMVSTMKNCFQNSLAHKLFRLLTDTSPAHSLQGMCT